MSGLTGLLVEATQVGEQLSCLVVKPDGSSQRYLVSLLSQNPQAALEALVRVTVSPANDAIIKANLAHMVKGLTLNLTDPIITPPTPPDPALAPFLADYAELLRADRATRAGLTTTVDVATIQARAQKTLSDHPSFESNL